MMLCFQTVVFWSLVVALYQLKHHRLTLIPLYAYIAVLTVFMHNLTDLGFSVIINDWFFLVSSFSFFTAQMFAILFLYLLEGPKTIKLSLLVILASSIFYAFVVYTLGFQADFSNWVGLNYSRATSYIWSNSAIIIDMIFMAMIWEILSKIRFLNLTTRIFLVMLSVFSLDALIFATGAFRDSRIYLPMLQGNIAIRLALSLIGAPIIASSLRSEGFDEEKRARPENFLKVLDPNSDPKLDMATLRGYIEEENKFWGKSDGAKKENQ